MFLHHVNGFLIGVALCCLFIVATNAHATDKPNIYTQYGKSILKNYHCPEDAYKFINTPRPNRYYGDSTQPQRVRCITTDSAARAIRY